jgi:hypothetical protein
VPTATQVTSSEHFTSLKPPPPASSLGATVEGDAVQLDPETSPVEKIDWSF